jgi:hypothetical protein
LPWIVGAVVVAFVFPAIYKNVKKWKRKNLLYCY